jgi:hypothetical protein
MTSALDPLDGNEVEAEGAGARNQRTDVLVRFRPVRGAAELKNVFCRIDRRHVDLVNEVALHPFDGGRRWKVMLIRHFVEVKRHVDLVAPMHVDPVLVTDTGRSKRHRDIERGLPLLAEYDCFGTALFRETSAGGRNEHLGDWRIGIDLDKFDAAVSFKLKEELNLVH